MLSFDSLDPDGIPPEDYKPGRRIFSTTSAITAGCFFVASLVLVGLLCGLLGKGKPCSPMEVTAVPYTTHLIEHSTSKTTIEPATTQQDTTPTTPSTSPQPSGPWLNYRLPGDLKPSHYDLEIMIDIVDQQRFWGNMTVLISCLNSTDLLMMHAKELEIIPGTAVLEKVSGDSASTAPGFRTEPWTYAENQYLVAELDDVLVAGEDYRFSVGFEAPLVDGGLVGLYRSSYNTAAGKTRYLAATFFAPTNARKAFPCFDEPAMKATFNLTIGHQPGYVALSNMPLTRQENITSPGGQGGGGDNWVKSSFERTLPMSTYIVCYVVCDFKHETMRTASNVTFSVWAREEAMPSVQYDLENGVKMLDYYDDYFGTKYPLLKMDMIAIPDFTAGAMENWGLITYRESALLYTPGQSAASNLQRISTVMGHELAHQWFGNLVSFEWWNDLWLKEGFASYVEYIGSNITEPDWGMLDQFVSADYYGAMEDDALTTSRPIIVDVFSADDINQQYDSIAYEKGSSIIRMIQNFLGERTFRRGLEIYLDRYKYDNAINIDLWNCFTEASEEHGISDIDVKQVMDTWTLQMGYPTIQVSRDYDSQSFQASQSRFLINPEANTTSPYGDMGYVWYVPLRYTTKADNEFVSPPLKWLSPDVSVTISLEGSAADDWLLVNIQSYGYYRVNYDASNWDLLTDQLRTSPQGIPISNRAGLISDAFNLAQSGDLSYVTALNMSLYLSREREYVPWDTAQRALGYIDLMLSRAASYGALKRYLRDLSSTFYDDVGWSDEGSGHLQQLGRVVAIRQACTYGNKDCISTARSFFQAWMEDPVNNTVPPNQKYNVYCTGIAEGGQTEWFFAFNLYETTIIASERALLLQALACSQRPWILSQYLDMTIDRIKSQDAVNVVTYVAGNPIGYDLAWKFFQTQWNFFRETYGSSLFQFAKLIRGVTSHFNTAFQLAELQDFIAEHPDQGTGAKALRIAVEQTRANVRWMDSFQSDVAQWLQWANSVQH